MRVKILGSAAGGGFPQWNCGCANCSRIRSGTFPGKARTQTQVAVSNDGTSWFLLGASPDLRAQIEATPELHPREGLRHSPIAGVVLASADLDHVLGLLSLRELHPLRVFATGSVLRILRDDNSMFRMLNRGSSQVSWTEMELDKEIPLTDALAADTGLRLKAVSLGTRYPAYVDSQRTGTLNPSEALLGLILTTNSGVRLAYMPAVPQVDDGLPQLAASANLLLFDGTFWSDDELIRVQGSGQTARAMGHIPVGPPEGSLRKLASLGVRRKIFLHINNTNPMLDESGPEFAAVRQAGWEVAEDGWQFEL